MTLDTSPESRVETGAPGPSVQELLAREKVPVPDALRLTSTADLGHDPIPVTRYTSRPFYDAEVEHLWPKVWQMACREEAIPDVGDVHVYEIGTRSALVVRTADGTIKAYPNACLHRGTELKAADCNVSELLCPFHGFCWNLDGTLANIPSPWDFPRLDPDELRLPELRVATWQGFVFVNFDESAPPLEEYLGGIVGHFESTARPPLDERFTAVHVAKVLEANWKTALEAFLESYHVITTHPQTMPYIDDVNTQYDVFPGEPHWNRMITALGVPSPHLGPGISEDDVAEALRRDQILLDVLTNPDPAALAVPEGGTAREMLAGFARKMVGLMTGFDAEGAGITDCEATDGIQYFVFPNFVPWPGMGAPIVYRFRPYGDRVDRCVMDLMLLYPCTPGQPRPPAPPVHWLADDEDFTAAPELGGLASGLNQDLDNIPRIQRGLHSTVKKSVYLADYQESRIRHFHTVLGRYVPDGGS